MKMTTHARSRAGRAFFIVGRLDITPLLIKCQPNLTGGGCGLNQGEAGGKALLRRERKPRSGATTPSGERTWWTKL